MSTVLSRAAEQGQDVPVLRRRVEDRGAVIAAREQVVTAVIR